MDEDGQAEYSGAETMGFQSPAQDHIEHVIDLARVLDLQKPGIYPVRVSGQAFAERDIKDGDILIANTAARPAHGIHASSHRRILSERYAEAGTRVGHFRNTS
jgi:hypothetical protein